MKALYQLTHKNKVDRLQEVEKDLDRILGIKKKRIIWHVSNDSQIRQKLINKH